MRRTAKTVNFGVIYGIAPTAWQAGIPARTEPIHRLLFRTLSQRRIVSPALLRNAENPVRRQYP